MKNRIDSFTYTQPLAIRIRAIRSRIVGGSVAIVWLFIVAASVGSVAGSQTATQDDESTLGPGERLAAEHLPDLLPMLTFLRDEEPKQYARAVRDLDRAASRLEIQQRRGPRFYDVALRQWQARGRIDLIRARLKVRPTEADRGRLLVEMQRLRKIELERLRLDDEALRRREAIYVQRAEQARAAVQRSRRQIDFLQQSIERLEAEPLTKQSPAYLRAAGLDRSGSTQSTRQP